MKRGPPFPFFVLPLKPARERPKVPGMQSLPVICVSFLSDLCSVCARARVCIPRQGTGRGGLRDIGLWLQRCSSGKGASEGHTEVSRAPASPALPLWPCPLELHPIAAGVGLLPRSPGETSGCAAVMEAASEHPVRNWLTLVIPLGRRVGAHPGFRGCPC